MSSITAALTGRLSNLRRVLIGAALLLVIAGLGAGVATRIGSAPRGGRAAALGNRRFNRGASSCSPTPSRAPRENARQPLLLGISAGIRLERGPARCEQAMLAAATGVHAVREDISWTQTEPQPDHYDWRNYDAVVRTASQAGLMVLPILDDAPQWAAPTGCLPSDPGPYASFAAATVSRYGPGGAFWRENPDLAERPLFWYELWNEPWTAACNGGPGNYARLVAAAVSAGRAASPDARFLVAGDSSYRTPAGTRADWIAGMYAAVPQIGRYIDALSVHPYGGDPTVYTPRGDTDEQPGRLEQAHAELAAHGDGGKPLWVTEIGWSTCTGASGCVSEAEQASYLKEFLDLALTAWRSYVRAVFVFDLRDAGPAADDDREAWFGLLRPDLSRKPAWWVLRGVAGELGG